MVKVVALVKVPKQQPLQCQSKRNSQERANNEGQRQAAKKTAQGISQIGAQHIKAAVRQVNDAHDAKNKRQAGGQHKQQQTVLHAVEQLNQKSGEVHAES